METVTLPELKRMNYLWVSSRSEGTIHLCLDQPQSWHAESRLQHLHRFYLRMFGSAVRLYEETKESDQWDQS